MEEQPPLELLDIDGSFMNMDVMDCSQTMENYSELYLLKQNFGETAQDEISDRMKTETKEKKTDTGVSDFPDALNDENCDNAENPECENQLGNEKRFTRSTAVGHGESSKDSHAGTDRVCFLHTLCTI